MEVFLIIGAVTAGLVWLGSLIQPPQSDSDQTSNEVRRIGDATIDAMRQTSKEFRDHIDRETRDYRR